MAEKIKETIAVYDQLAQAYEDKFMNMDLYDDTYDLFCDLIQKQNAKILELACGPGNITRYIRNKRPDFEIIATDASPKMVEKAQKNNPEVECMVLEAGKIYELKELFDGVICGFGLPYLSKLDVGVLIVNTFNRLNSDGIFYFSLIEDSYDKSAYESSSDGRFSVFIYYHELEYLREYFEKSNLTLLHVIRKPFSKPDGSISTHLILIGRKR